MEAGLQEKTDGDLVAAVQAGRREAYGRLIRRYTGRVYGVCLGILGDPTAAEDIAQETFMRGLTQIHTLREAGNFPGWIAQIARNLCRDRIKVRNRRRELLAENRPAGPVDKDEYAGLYSALERLSQENRLALVCYYLDGHDIHGVAEELGVREGAAYTRLSRARRKLREILEEGEAK
jgi:RNA polymerase sigma-70 factor (ECF subfamily)